MNTNNELKCEKVRELLPNYSVGAATLDECTLVEAHVSECANCADELAALNKTGELLSMISLDPAPDLWNAISADLGPRHAGQGVRDWFGGHRFHLTGMAVATAALVMAALFLHPKMSVHEDAGNYLAQHASMSWREPFADKAGLGLIDVAYAAPVSEASH